MSTDNYENYGVLYNWAAVMSVDVCPSGWHIPSDSEFNQLSDFLGGKILSGVKMKDDILWDGNNLSGFSGLPGGTLSTVYSPEGYAAWWTSSDENVIDQGPSGSSDR